MFHGKNSIRRFAGAQTRKRNYSRVVRRINNQGYKKGEWMFYKKDNVKKFLQQHNRKSTRNGIVRRIKKQGYR